MATLKVDSSRGFHTIELELLKSKKAKSFKIPTELLVYEAERLLELKLSLQYKMDESVKEQDVTAHAECMTDIVFDQLVILFRHYQPDITKEYLKENIYINDAIRIVSFFEENKLVIEQPITQVKKNSKLDKDTNELKEFRRRIIFMVRNNFTLHDVKHMYLDEFLEYYKELIYSLEQSGEIKEGTYDTMSNIDRTQDNLRGLAEMFKSKSK